MAKREQEGGLAASILDRLLDDDPRAGDPRVDSLDLKHLPQLAKKLQSGNDPLERYIRNQAYPEDLATLDQYDGETPVPRPVVAAMVDILNRVIFGPFLYERQRFGNIRLSAETVTLMEDSRKSKNASSFNRMLLDEAYAEELEKMRKPTPPSLSLIEKRPEDDPVEDVDHRRDDRTRYRGLPVVLMQGCEIFRIGLIPDIAR